MLGWVMIMTGVVGMMGSWTWSAHRTSLRWNRWVRLLWGDLVVSSVRWQLLVTCVVVVDSCRRVIMLVVVRGRDRLLLLLLLFSVHITDDR